MKKNKILILVTALFFLLFASTVYASTKTWLVDEDGFEQKSSNIVETGDSIDIGRVRFRQDNETVGLLKEGDRITVTLRNAVFNSMPKLENPIVSLNNDAGQTGKFFLVPIEKYDGLNVNSITYELVEKTVDEYGYAYENIDYVFYFNDIKPISGEEIKVEFSSNSNIVLPTGPIVTNTPITVAKVVKKNTVSAEKQLFSNEFEELSVEIEKYLENKNYYTINDTDIKIDFPKTFFYEGDNWNFFADTNPYNFKVVINKYESLKYNNPEFSESAGIRIFEINPYVYNRLTKANYLMREGNYFYGTKVTLKFLTLDENIINKLVPLKYVRQEDGSMKKQLFTSGVYNRSTREYSFNINGPGFYSVEQKDINKISMVINDSVSRVNNNVVRLDVSPMLINNSTYVPLRFIAENLGAEVEFLADTNQVQIKTSEKTIYLPIDKVTAELSTPARIIEGRTMVPVRYVSEQLGAVVSYFADTRTIEIIK